MKKIEEMIVKSHSFFARNFYAYEEPSEKKKSEK